VEDADGSQEHPEGCGNAAGLKSVGGAFSEQSLLGDENNSFSQVYVPEEEDQAAFSLRLFTWPQLIDNRNGTYQVMFTAPPRGRYLVHIHHFSRDHLSCDSHEPVAVKGSPFLMTTGFTSDEIEFAAFRIQRTYRAKVMRQRFNISQEALEKVHRDTSARVIQRFFRRFNSRSVEARRKFADMLIKARDMASHRRTMLHYRTQFVFGAKSRHAQPVRPFSRPRSAKHGTGPSAGVISHQMDHRMLAKTLQKLHARVGFAGMHTPRVDCELKGGIKLVRLVDKKTHRGVGTHPHPRQLTGLDLPPVFNESNRI
jgi:hypothetical protein